MKRILCVFLSLITLTGICILHFPVYAASKRVGDVDDDGWITAADARLCLRFSVGLEELDFLSQEACDTDGDWLVTASDARNILRFAVGYPSDTLRHPAQVEENIDLTEKDLPEDARILYMTFDDGPSSFTTEILDILDHYKVRATFFVLYNPYYTAKYSEIVERGQTIALHCYTHNYDEIYTSKEAYFKDLHAISDYVYNLTGVRTNLIRFPGGSSNTISMNYKDGIMSELVTAVEEEGYHYFDWNYTNDDATGEKLTWEEIYAAAIEPIDKDVKKVILLMHDTDAKQTTVEALPHIIEDYKDAGYYIIALNENSPGMHHKVQN